MTDADPNLPLWLGFMALARQATRDPLTGLYNRRYFDETLADHVEAARRYGRELSLVLFDLDGFKQINDSQGHPAGDKALQQVAALLRSHTRKADIVCRCGGDEFAVILPETGEAAAGAFAARMMGALSASELSLSATAGIASLPCSELIQAADAALLENKRRR